MSETDGFRKLGPGALVFVGGVGILTVRDPLTALGTSLSFAGLTLMVYAVLKDILDRFSMTLTDLL